VAAVIGRRAAAVALSLTLAAAVARAEEVSPGTSRAAPSDSSFNRFLEGLADSTDRYFGIIAAPLDTTGLDSAMVVAVGTQWRGLRTRPRFSYRPAYAFNRVDGSLWGASAALSERHDRWRVGGDLGYAAGSDRLLGGGEVRLGLRRRDRFFGLSVRAGRRTAGMDRDHDEPRLATVRALVSGSDRQHYLRRDGIRVALGGAGRVWRAGVEYRDQLESPLLVTTRWNLARDPLEAPTNLAAAFGRTRELTFSASARLPGLPFQSQVTQAVSDHALGSDFDYRRARLALGGELAVARHLSFLPQLVYGRLGGDPVPQASFYLGGAHTLRSLPAAALAGTGFAFGRLEVVGADDLLALAHLPHPAMFPIQGALFVASGAVWGADAYGGPGTPAGAWPERSSWLSEVGGSLLYRPGIPDGETCVRLNYARPLGGNGHSARWSISYARALDLLRSF
jgi:hypothetical protein